MSKKQITIITMVIIVILLLVAGVFLYLNYSKKPVSIIPVTKEDVVKNYLGGATTGKDDKGTVLSPDQRQELYNKSVELLALYIQNNPNDVDALTKLAGAYYNVGNLDKAAETFQKIVVLDPNNALVHNNLANVLRDSGKYSEAEGDYKRSIEISPNLSAPYFNLAVMYGLENKKDEAIKILEEGLIKNPGDETLKQLLGEYKNS